MDSYLNEESVTNEKNDNVYCWNQEDEIEEAQMQQLQILDTSIHYTWLIVIAILITLCALEKQRCQIINQTSEGSDEIYCLRGVGSILVIFALTYFLKLSQTLISNETETTSCSQRRSNQINHCSSILVWLASAFRLFDLMCNRSGDTEIDT